MAFAAKGTVYAADFTLINMQQMNSWETERSIHQANMQTIAKQSESKNTKSSSIKIEKLNDLARAVAALSYYCLWFL